MTLSKALRSISHTLSIAEIDDASTEAELLLCHVLGISTTQLYTETERALTSVEINNLQRLIQRRLLHEPVAYILRYCEFYGIAFYIDERALIPRPETETLVEKATEIYHHSPSAGSTIADIGTGSGALAISIALALPQAKIYATDISASALQVAEINCRRHQIDSQVELLQGNLLEPLPKPVDMIVANLPYVRDSELQALSPEIINFEPIIALGGGKNGLDKIQQLLEQIPGKLNHGGHFLLEIGQYQGEAVTSLISNHFPQASIELTPDLSGIDRVVKVGV
ncbi:MAG: peptide chain release factor N(5)-glutamine methyltransferase [Dehalococcoidia bacterium]|nr:peptide chain release factor N(5)-glutamine methyltransferase [Dehalococcoidia bacterium]